VTRAAIVTGGGTGIGRATALALHRDGFSVVIAGRRLEPLEAVREQIGDTCVVIRATSGCRGGRALIGVALERLAVSTHWSTTPAASSSRRPRTSRPTAGRRCSGST
jgi:NAD(P)-dependent dehydrogenase (short-subunit alcohol dehydrogenase family)